MCLCVLVCWCVCVLVCVGVCGSVLVCVCGVGGRREGGLGMKVVFDESGLGGGVGFG